MKILWFTLTPCGASKEISPNLHGCGWLSSLENRLVASGAVELHICFQSDLELSSFTKNGVTYHPVKRISYKKVLAQKIFKRCTNELLAKYLDVVSVVKPDLIHVHGTEEGFGLVQRCTNIPVAISIQGILSNIACKYFSGIPRYRFLLDGKLLPHLKLKSIFWIYQIFLANAQREREILRMTKNVIGRTDWDRRTLSILAPQARYYHGDEILRAPFYEAQWNKDYFSDPLRIVTVCSAGAYKGFEAVLQVARILREVVGVDFEWTVVGLSVEDTVPKVVHKWLGIQPNVVLVGNKGVNDVRDVLLASDIFCQVSHIENSPNSLCEAMVLGMPIVATFAGGTDTILSAGKEGLIVQDGDPWSMAGAIVEISKNFDRAAEMGKTARGRALLRHNPDLIIAGLIHTYESIITECAITSA